MNKSTLIGLMTAFLLAAPTGSWSENLFDREASDVHFQKGLRLYFQERYDPATREFEEAVNINPDHARAYYFLGYAYYRLGKFQEARTAFEQAYNMNPEYSPIPRQ